MNSSIWFDTMSLGRFIVHMVGCRLDFLSLIANSAILMKFHLSSLFATVHCTCLEVTSIQRVKVNGYLKVNYIFEILTHLVYIDNDKNCVI